jgi:cob(I)alamin adenosyltransferase
MQKESERPKKKGLILIYTGNGKGKTTAALGLALRAVGQKKKTAMIQFIKNDRKTGELLAAPLLAPFFELTPFGAGFIGLLNDNKSWEEHRQAAEYALTVAREKARSGRYDILILDEINYAIRGKLLDIRAVKELLSDKPDRLHVVLTGRNAHPELLEMADLVTEMKEIRHPFAKGIRAQCGIDY